MNEYICTSRAYVPITFLTVGGRVLSQTLTPPILSFLALIKTFLKCWSTLIAMKYTYIREPKAHFYDLHLYKRTFCESFINKSSLVINYC